MHKLTRLSSTRGFKTFLFVVVVLVTGVAPQLATIKVASADDGGYPWIGAGYVDPNYDWGYVINPPSEVCPSNDAGCSAIYQTINNVKYGEADPWVYNLRNCTSYAAWKINQVFGVSNITGWGNAATWNTGYINSQPYPVHAKGSGYTPQVGDIAQWGSEVGGGSGHVAYVTAYNASTGIASLDDYNQAGTGNFSSSNTTASNSENTPDNYIHIGNVSSQNLYTSAPSAFIDSSGNYNVLAEQNTNAVQYERNSGTWAGQPIQAVAPFVGSHPPLALSDSSNNYHFFAATNGGVNEYDKPSGSGSWNSGSVVESSGTPTSGIGGFIDWSGNINLFFDTSGGLDHYEYSNGSWTGEVLATGTFLSTPTAFEDSSSVYHVFVQSTGSINHYAKSASGGLWGGEQVATGSSFNSPPTAFVDPSGNFNVFVNTTGGMNHYEKSGLGSWGGEVVTNNSSLVYWPASYYSGDGGYYIVYTETAGAIQQYWKSASGGSWGSGTPATLTPSSGISANIDSSYYDNVYVTTTGSLNHYEHLEGSPTWNGEEVAHN